MPGLGVVGERWSAGSGRIARWVGRHVLHIAHPIAIEPTGSSDGTWSWIRLSCLVAFSLVVAVGPMPPHRMFMPIGEQSPMGLMWTFMGYSVAYNVFAGGAELVGGVLLLFRRTTPLGALVILATMTNVVMLDFCFDVPVKIDATHYLLAAIVLLWPDVGRLADVLVRGRATAASPCSAPSPRRWLRLGAPALKVAVISWMVLAAARDKRDNDRAFHATPAAFAGLWNVDAETRDGQPIPPLVDDTTRWRRVSFLWGRTIVSGMDELPMLFAGVTIDEAARTLTIVPDSDPGQRWTLRYRRQGDHLLLDGNVGPHALRLDLRQLDVGKMRLASRGFHFINERAYNY